jgi:hypothetical protein
MLKVCTSDDESPLVMHHSQAWSFGSFDKDTFVFQSSAEGRSALVIKDLGGVGIRQSHSVAVLGNATRLLLGALRLGEFRLGAASDGSFVIELDDWTNKSTPLLTLTPGGALSTLGQVHPFDHLGATWRLSGNEGSDRVLQLGNWWIGDRGAKHFVIQRVGAAMPEIMLRHDGALFVRNLSTAISAITLPRPWCDAADISSFLPRLDNTAWNVASKSGQLVTPPMVQCC